MYILGTFMIAIAEVLSLIISLYTYIILGSVIISWVNADPNNPIVRLLRQATEPLFRHIRRWMPRALFRFNLDFTPIIALILLIFLRTMLVNTLVHYGSQIATSV